ncbi:hypothetical protein ATERTT37_005762 [Aspergillus terreus]
MAAATVQSQSSFVETSRPSGSNVLSSVREKPHDVHTTLNFVKVMPDGSHLAPNYVGRPETYDRPVEALPVTIHDVSGRELEYTLDSHGFQFYYHESQTKNFDDNDQVRSEYYPETEQLLKDATGASRVFIFDHTIRRQTKNDLVPESERRGPVQRVHIDQSYDAAKERVLYHLPEDAPELLKGRYQIINVWRPIKTILKSPLAVANAHSVSDSDILPVKLIYPNRVGETCTVKPNPNIEWYYRYGQTPDLVTLIKCFDSKTDGRARRVPHSAFVDPATEHEAPRESIEVRALVFHPDDRE